MFLVRERVREARLLRVFDRPLTDRQRGGASVDQRRRRRGDQLHHREDRGEESASEGAEEHVLRLVAGIRHDNRTLRGSSYGEVIPSACDHLVQHRHEE